MKSRSYALAVTAAVLALSLSPGPGEALAEPGRVVWETVFPGEPSEDGYRAGGLAQDAQGNIFVAGTMSAKSGDTDYLVLKYGPDVEVVGPESLLKSVSGRAAEMVKLYFK